MNKKDLARRRAREEFGALIKDVERHFARFADTFNRHALLGSSIGTIAMLLSMRSYFDAHGASHAMQWIIGESGTVATVGLLALITCLAFIASVLLGVMVMDMYREMLKLDLRPQSPVSLARPNRYATAWVDLAAATGTFAWLLAGLFGYVSSDSWLVLPLVASIVGLLCLKGRTHRWSKGVLAVEFLMSTLMYTMWLLSGMLWFLLFIMSMSDYITSEANETAAYSLILLAASLAVFLVFSVQRLRYTGAVRAAVMVLVIVFAFLPYGEGAGTVLRTWNLGGYPAVVQSCDSSECKAEGVAKGDVVYVLLPVGGDLMLRYPTSDNGKLVAIPATQIQAKRIPGKETKSGKSSQAGKEKSGSPAS